MRTGFRALDTLTLAEIEAIFAHRPNLLSALPDNSYADASDHAPSVDLRFIPVKSPSK